MVSSKCQTSRAHHPNRLAHQRLSPLKETMEREPTPRRIFEQGHIVEEIDFCDPLALFAPLASDPFALFLDSSATTLESRWSFIATDPFATLTVEQGQTYLNGENVAGTGFDLLSELTEEYALPQNWLSAHDDAAAPPFAGGLAGFIGYDMGHALETLPKRKSAKPDTPDMAIGAYDCVLAFDNRDRRAFIVSTGLPEKTVATRAARAEARAAKWRARLRLRPSLPKLIWPESPAPESLIQTRLTRSDYEARVQKVIDYIYAGDIFQANLSQVFVAQLPEDDTPFALYQRLRTLSPAPFAGFFNFGSGELLSSSPERFLKLAGCTIETKPIKGTRPRGTTAHEDKAFADELLHSEKDHAENTMIVDLLRNDISRVAEPGSLRVPHLCALETYANVHHLVSTVTAALAEPHTATDLIKACFPGGSITGAPKIRAMEIIHELEDEDRGPYCGSLGYISFDGRMDMNISIRTITLNGKQATFRTGGGIVADSNPEAEHDETLAKARAMADAIRGVRPQGHEQSQASTKEADCA